jgi:hypothetical protein
MVERIIPRTRGNIPKLLVIFFTRVLGTNENSDERYVVWTRFDLIPSRSGGIISWKCCVSEMGDPSMGAICIITKPQ